MNMPSFVELMDQRIISTC